MALLTISGINGLLNPEDQLGAWTTDSHQQFLYWYDPASQQMYRPIASGEFWCTYSLAFPGI